MFRANLQHIRSRFVIPAHWKTRLNVGAVFVLMAASGVTFQTKQHQEWLSKRIEFEPNSANALLSQSLQTGDILVFNYSPLNLHRFQPLRTLHTLLEKSIAGSYNHTAFIIRHPHTQLSYVLELTSTGVVQLLPFEDRVLKSSADEMFVRHIEGRVAADGQFDEVELAKQQWFIDEALSKLDVEFDVKAKNSQVSQLTHRCQHWLKLVSAALRTTLLSTHTGNSSDLVALHGEVCNVRVQQLLNEHRLQNVQNELEHKCHSTIQLNPVDIDYCEMLNGKLVRLQRQQRKIKAELQSFDEEINAAQQASHASTNDSATASESSAAQLSSCYSALFPSTAFTALLLQRLNILTHPQPQAKDYTPRHFLSSTGGLPLVLQPSKQRDYSNNNISSTQSKHLIQLSQELFVKSKGKKLHYRVLGE